MLDFRRKPVDILKGRETLSPKEYGEWIAAVNDYPPDEVEYDPDTDIIWQIPGSDGILDGTTILHDPRPAWKPKRKRVKTMGHSLKSFADLSVLTRAWRKPNYKNLRYLYVKHGIIVEYERMTRRAPANAHSLAVPPGETVKHINKRIAALGADSLFTVHNHYSDYSRPSETDREIADLLGEAPALKGHIILSYRWFGLIVVKGLAILRPLVDLGTLSADPATGALLNATDAMVYEDSIMGDWAKALTRRKTPVICSIHDELVSGELEKIRLDKIDTWNQLVDKMAADTDFECPSLAWISTEDKSTNMGGLKD
jgi:hypothetical protein